MADREFNVRISAETDDFSRGIDRAEREARELGVTLERDIGEGADSATQSLNEVTDELRRLQREAIGGAGSIGDLGDSLSNASSDADRASSSVNELNNETSSLDGSVDSASSSVDGFRNSINRLQSDLDDAKRVISELRSEMERLKSSHVRVNTSINETRNTFSSTRSETNKFEREMQRLSMVLGGEVPESTRQAYAKLYELNQEARKAKRYYGAYSKEALNARDAITQFALGLDDTTFKQIYMRSQLGLTDAQLRQQANSIKLNARMTKLMGNQTQILVQRMQGLAKHGVKPEMMLPPSTIGQFQLLNETVNASGRGIYNLSSMYRNLGGSVEKVIKNYSAQKVAIREAQGDMVKYGLLLRGITTANANMALAFPIVGLAALTAYKTMFNAALEADEGLKKLAEITKSKVLTALEPLINTAGRFLEVALKVIGVVSDWIAKFNEAHPVIANIVGAIGFLLPAMTLLLLPLQMGIGLWNGWMVALNGVWTMFGGVVSMIGLASSTFLALAGVIGAVVAAFIYLWNTNEGFKNACIGIWETIKSAIQTALEAIKTFIATHADTVKNVLKNAYEACKQVIGSVMKEIGTIVKGILDSIKAFWKENGESIKQACKTVYEALKTIIQGVLDAISAIVKAVLDNIKSFWQQHGETIKSVASKIWEQVKQIIKATLDIILGIIKAVTSAINGDWSTFWNTMFNVVKTILTGIANTIKTIVGSFPGIISSFAGAIGSAFKAILNAGLNAAKSFGSALLSVGKNLVQGLANGIKSGASAVVSAISSTIKNAIAAGKRLLGINSPSKLFMQFGEWTTEGYEIGVNRGEPKSTRAIEDFANNSINTFTTTALPASNNNSNSSIDNSNYTININAGNLNSERDMYKLAQIIDKKLAEIKQNKSISRGGARVVY